jgi:hypothetical protein
MRRWATESDIIHLMNARKYLSIMATLALIIITLKWHNKYKLSRHSFHKSNIL